MIYCNDYIYDITHFSKQLNLDFLQNTNLLISGGTGLIGSYLIDSLLINKNFNIKITCLTTSIDKAQKRFSYFKKDKRLSFVECDLTKDIKLDNFPDKNFDYILHLASFADQINFATYPTETMLMNFIGCKNLLDIAKNTNVKKFLFSSSCEIYGTSTEEMVETNFGSVNPLDIRSCYNESKRASETLCVSYSHQFNIDVVIARLCRIYGPTMLIKDSKALSQFLKNSLKGEDIVLKSKGDQIFSFCYVSDAVSALLTLLEKGDKCNAYNISNNSSLPSLKEIAEITSRLSKTEVIIQEQTELEKKGYSRAVKAILPSDKINALGWNPKVNIEDKIKQTYTILKEVYKKIP